MDNYIDGGRNQDHIGCCGTCKYHRYQKRDTYICENNDSESYACYTDYKDGCEEYIEKY